MTTWREHRRAPLHALLGRAASWLIAPPRTSAREPDRSGDAGWAPPLAQAPATHAGDSGGGPDPPRPVVAVLGLARGVGTSTIARAIAARLAAFDPARAAVLYTADPPRGLSASPAASRLARSVLTSGCEAVRAAGRLCTVAAAEPLAPLAATRPAPIVADLEHGQPADGAIALADYVVLVAAPSVEPALVGAVETSLRGSGASVSTVLNRTAEEPPPELASALVVPDSRLAAQLTLACREPRGALAEIAAELAERSLAEVWR